MRIVCDACEAKYFVPDDKVSRAVIRLTCQKCGHVIIARRDEVAASTGAAELRSRLGMGGRAPESDAPPAPKEPAEWYYSRDGQSYGPFTAVDLERQFADGALGAECYVWHRELGEWQPAHSTDPFARHIASRHDSPTAASNPIVSAGLDSALAGDAGAAAVDVEPGPRVRALREALEQIDEEPDIEIAIDEAAEEPEAADDLDDDKRTTPDDHRPAMDEAPAQHGAYFTAAPGPSSGQQAAVDPASDGLDDEAFLNSDVIDLDADELAASTHTVPIGANGRMISDDLPVLDIDVAGSTDPGLKGFGPKVRRESSDLFAAIDISASRDSSPEEPPVERSMMIHIDHLKKQNRRPRLYALLAALSLVLLGAIVWSVMSSSERSPEVNEVRYTQGAALASARGEVIDDAQFERLAPLDDFTMTELDTSSEGELVAIATEPERAPEGTEPGGEEERPGRRHRRGGTDVVEQKSTASNAAGDGSTQEPRTERDPEPNPDGATPEPTGEQPVRPVNSGEIVAVGPDSPAVAVRQRRSSAASLAGFGGSSRTSVDLRGASDVAKASSSGGSKYASGTSRQVKTSERSQFMTGLKQISKSVQECHKRQLKSGALEATKVYITIKVEPNGTVSKTTIDTSVAGTPFEKCLLSKTDRWTFETFEGKAVELRQGFVLE